MTLFMHYVYAPNQLFKKFNLRVIALNKNHTKRLHILSPGNAWICSWCSHIFQRRFVLLACRESGRTEFPGEAPGWGWLSRLSCTGWILLDASPSAWWWAPAQCSAGKTNWPTERRWIGIFCRNIVYINLQIGCWICLLSLNYFLNGIQSKKSIMTWKLILKQSISDNKKVQYELAVYHHFRGVKHERVTVKQRLLSTLCCQSLAGSVFAKVCWALFTTWIPWIPHALGSVGGSSERQMQPFH